MSKTVESLRHKDKRRNIPTEELRDFVKEDEDKPRVILYPRDPSLDPQLVWKGKDEQDRKDLAVPAVPIYIQEKIHPQAIIEDVRREFKKEAEPQASLFADFNGLDFEQQIDFYHHEANWSNRMILGDSLYVMTSLAEKEGLKGQVQMIYIDPPYGIKFGSNWQVSTKQRDIREGKPEHVTRQPEQIRAFRDTWQYGIHSYLSYLRDRLVVARELLSESGSIFIQIGDENLHLVRCLLDEVFGSENFISLVSVQKTSGFSPLLLSNVVDYLLWYGKKIEFIKYRNLNIKKIIGQEGATQYNFVEEPEYGLIRPLEKEEKANPQMLGSDARLLAHGDLSAQGLSSTPDEPYKWRDRSYSLPANSHWKTKNDGLNRLSYANRLLAIGNSLRYKRFLSDFPVFPINNIWTDTSVSGFADKKTYVVQTNSLIIQRCLIVTTDPGDLVLDPTCVRQGTQVLTPLNFPAGGGKEGEAPLSPPVNGGKEETEAAALSPSPLTGRVGVGSSSSPLTGRAGVGPF
ncbi:MAG: site-specific DNA-methyltransferase, partial [Thermodesulfobacteriota bacterium]